MGYGLRLSAGLAAFVAILALGLQAQADEFASCWVTQKKDPFLGQATTVTRCRLAGGDVVDYASDAQVPARLYPNAGTDVTGSCWYLTSLSTRWVYISLFVDGDAVLGWQPDTGSPGTIALATGRIPRCTSEPVPEVRPVEVVWDYVTSYVHDPPTPALSPPPGAGITGMATYVGVTLPENHSAQLTAPSGLAHGHGVGRGGGFEADREEDDFTLRLAGRDIDRVEW